MDDDIVNETGAILTDEMIEALAAEAEEGYDLSGGEIVRVGRPPLDGGLSASPRLTIRTTPSLLKALHDRAEAEGRSVSEVARSALEEYVSS